MNAAAKTETKVNKSKFIRELLEKNSEMPNAEIIAAAAALKPPLVLDAGLISVTRSKLKASAGGKATSTKAGKRSLEPTLKQVMTVLKEAGGIGEIAKALKVLEGAKEAQTLIDKLGGEKSALEIAELLKGAK